MRGAIQEGSPVRLCGERAASDGLPARRSRGAKVPPRDLLGGIEVLHNRLESLLYELDFSGDPVLQPAQLVHGIQRLQPQASTEQAIPPCIDRGACFPE